MISNKAGPLSFFPLKGKCVIVIFIMISHDHLGADPAYDRIRIWPLNIMITRGASCSNIGRIRTKENIAVGTLLIGNAKATGGYMIVFES